MEPTRFTDSNPVLGTGGGRVEFTMPKVRKFVDDRAIKVLWEDSFLCPCRNPMTGAPDSSCKICHGRGVGYLPAKEEELIIQSQDKSVTNADLGLYDSGTAIATTQPEATISFRDRITLPEVEIYQSMIFDVTKRRVEQGMWLSYDVKNITLAMTNNGVPLQENEDYTFTEEKNLFFPREHLMGQNVSLNITTTLRYIVIDLLKESRYQYTDKGTQLEKFTNLPKKMLLKREDAWVNPTPFSFNDDVEAEVNGESSQDPKRIMSTGGFFGGGLNE